MRMIWVWARRCRCSAICWPMKENGQERPGKPKDEGVLPSLIVCPASLVLNWAEECQKFTPELNCVVVDGDAAHRAQLAEQWDGADVVVTSYDLLRRDEEGFYYLVDRKKDVVVSGGENIYPVQIEDFLRTNDKIKDVAVSGLPDKRLGEICGAVIELKPGVTCTEEEIQDFCMDLPRYKRPRKIIFAPVPRNPTGKIEKPKLREKYCGVRLVEAQNRA